MGLSFLRGRRRLGTRASIPRATRRVPPRETSMRAMEMKHVFPLKTLAEYERANALFRFHAERREEAERAFGGEGVVAGAPPTRRRGKHCWRNGSRGKTRGSETRARARRGRAGHGRARGEIRGVAARESRRSTRRPRSGDPSCRDDSRTRRCGGAPRPRSTRVTSLPASRVTGRSCPSRRRCPPSGTASGGVHGWVRGHTTATGDSSSELTGVRCTPARMASSRERVRRERDAEMRGCAPRRVMCILNAAKAARNKKTPPGKTAARRALMSWFLARFHLAGFVHARAALE